MEVLAALADGGDEGDAEASAPVAEEVGERGGPVVLRGAELRVGDDGERHEEEGVTETLQGAGESVVSVVGVEVEVAVVDERDTHDHDGSEKKDLRADEAALDELCAYWCEEGDDERSGPEDEAGVDGAVAVEGLEELRDHRGGCEESEAEDEVEDVGDGEVADLEHAQVDDGIGLAQLPEDGGGEAADADDEHPDDEGRAEPVVDLAAVEEDLECSGAESDEGYADAVDAKFPGFSIAAGASNGLALLGVGLGIVDEAAGEEEGEDADGNVDEEDPTPVVVVGDPAAEDRADGGSGDDSDGVESEG